MLEVANLQKQYPTPRGPLTVLSDVTFSLVPGEAAAIMGPSGSGKNSLLYVIGALEPPSAGTVRLGGRDLSAATPAELADLPNADVGAGCRRRRHDRRPRAAPIQHPARIALRRQRRRRARCAWR